ELTYSDGEKVKEYLDINVIFDSSNSGVAAVSPDGLVTINPEGRGTATITARHQYFNERGEVSSVVSDFSITVSGKSAPPPTGNGSGSVYDYKLGEPVRTARWEYIENGYHDKADVSFLYAMKVKLNIHHTQGRQFNLTYQDEPYNTYSCTKYYPASANQP